MSLSTHHHKPPRQLLTSQPTKVPHCTFFYYGRHQEDVSQTVSLSNNYRKPFSLTIFQQRHTGQEARSQAERRAPE